MNVVLTTPYAHPHVHRGGERYVHDLGSWLRGRGHAVTILTTTANASYVAADASGTEVRYVHRGRPIGRGRLRLDDLLRVAAPIARGARTIEPDVVQCHHYVDAVGVRLGRRHRAPYVMWIPGVPRRASVGGRPLHRAAFWLAREGAARLHTLSRFAADTLRRDFGVTSVIVPPGVATDRYGGPRADAPVPTVLCAAAADDPRKRVDLLVGAFVRLLEHRPDARLVLAQPESGPAERVLARLEPPARAQAEAVVIEGADDLAALYRRATVSVLPSLHEAFGLVVVESLAAGTPVVATDHGALPEILDDPAVGRLFAADADEEGVATALVDAIDLGRDVATAERCRAHARRWDWSVVGPQLEEIYGSLVA